MYSALVELMQPEIDEAVNEAVSVAVSEAVKRTRDEVSNETTARMTVEAVNNAIKKLGMSKEEACVFMDITVAKYDAYREIMKNLAVKEL